MGMYDNELDLLNASRETFFEKNNVENLMENQHPIIDELLKNKKEWDKGGTQITGLLRIDNPGKLHFYKGRTIPAKETKPITKRFTAPWAKCEYTIDLPGDTDYVNQNDGQIVDDADETMQAAIEHLPQELAYHFFNSDGSADDKPLGLPAIEAPNAPYLGVNPADVPQWQVQRYGTAAAPKAWNLSGVDEFMVQMWARGSRPTKASLSQANFNVLLAAVRSLLNIPLADLKAKGEKADVGMPMDFYYNNCQFRLDFNCADTEVHFHDFRNFGIYIPKSKKRGLNFSEWKFREEQNMDEYYSRMLAAIQFICKRRDHQGVYHVDIA